jgi:hypothetical protein
MNNAALGCVPEYLRVRTKSNRIRAMEKPGIKCHHATPTAADAHSISPREYVVTTLRFPRGSKPRIERKTYSITFQVASCVGVVELESVAEVHCTRGSVLRNAISVRVGAKQKLKGLDRVKDNVVQIKYFVVRHAGAL